MGKSARERKMRIRSGMEMPIGLKMKLGADSMNERFRTCLLCFLPVPLHNCLQHVQRCWGITYREESDIPKTPPLEAVAYYRSMLSRYPGSRPPLRQEFFITEDTHGAETGPGDSMPGSK